MDKKLFECSFDCNGSNWTLTVSCLVFNIFLSGRTKCDWVFPSGFFSAPVTEVRFVTG